MKRVLFILGSRNVNSKQLKFAQNVSLMLPSTEFFVEILTPNDWVLHPVLDSSVFMTGIDGSDNFEGDYGQVIKEKILSSDIVFFGSPVYSHAVSSDMKLLIERISGWLHIFRLLGKPCISIVAASSNGFMEVQEYLEYIMESLGMDVVESILLLDNKNNYEIEINNAYKAVLRATSPDYIPKVGRIAEQQFSYYKRTYKPLSRDLAEPKYWEDKGWFELSTLQEYLDIESNAS